MKALKQILDSLYRDCDFQERIRHDPISFPHRYQKTEDIETAGFIASSLAYGRVGLFMPVIEKILNVMGASPYKFLAAFNPKKHGHLFCGIRYRFQKTDDIVALLYIISVILNKYGSIGRLFKMFHDKNDPDTERMLSSVIDNIFKINTSCVYGSNIRPKGLSQLFPSPSNGGACKRANLYLRWMIRNKDIDFGIWHGIPKNKLIIPLDTHIARIARNLGLTGRKTQDWKMAVEITSALKAFDPEDPLKYDFTLCHIGISGGYKPLQNKGYRSS